MPTGYTAGVQDGTVTSFKDFAIQCARAFGALILMRDDPLDTPIPDEFQPSDYHVKNLEESTNHLKALQEKSDDELKVEFDAYLAERFRLAKAGIKEKQQQLVRYSDMLAKVQQWKPPTSDHENMKQFMVKQLTESIEWDCGGTFWKDELDKASELTFQQWKDDEIASCFRSIAYHTKEHAEEIKRTQERNEWVRKLRESLEAESVNS